MAYFHYVSASVGGALNTVGDLKLKQKQPLFHSGLDIRYNVSIKIQIDFLFCIFFSLSFFSLMWGLAAKVF